MSILLIIISVIVATLLGIVSNILSSVLQPKFEKKKRILWSTFIGLVVLSIILAVFGKDNSEDSSPNQTSENDTDTPRLDKLCPDFSENFDSNSLYIVITRFEDYINNTENECYGRGIETLIDEIARKNNLPIIPCYLDNLSPNNRNDAIRVLQMVNADIIIWGKLSNAKENCTADGFCLKFISSDTLKLFAQEDVPEKTDLEYQQNVSIQQIEAGMINMGKEVFEGWLIGMSNLKIGKIKPEFYKISDKWSKAKQAEGYQARAFMYSSLGIYSKARKDFEAFLLLDNQSLNNNKDYILNNQVSAYANIGISYIKEGKYEQAVDYLNKAIAFDSGWIKLLPPIVDSIELANKYYQRARAKFELGKYEDAIKDCTESIALVSKNAGAYSGRGSAYGKLNKYSESLNDFNKAVEIDSTNHHYYSNRALIKIKMHLFSSAIEDLDKAIFIDNSYYTDYLQRAEAKVLIGKFKQAKSDCNRAIFLNKNNIEDKIKTYATRAYINYNLKNYEQVIDDLNFVIQNQPNLISIFYSLRAEAKEELAKHTEAISDCNIALQLDNKNPTAYLVKAKAQMKLKRYQAAIKDCERAFHLGINDARAYNIRGEIKRHLKMYPESIIDYRKSLSLDKEKRYKSKSISGLAKSFFKNRQYILAFRIYFFNSGRYLYFIYLSIIFAIIYIYKKKIINFIRAVSRKKST